MDEAAVTELFDAIAGGDSGAVEERLALEPGLIGARRSDGLSPIVFAAYYGHTPIVDLLLRRGAPLDVFGAATVGRADVLRTALAADPGLISAYSPDGWTLLHLASFFGHDDIVEFLLAEGADTEAIARNEQGNTPLHAALANRRTEIARRLLDAGADSNAARVDGLTPLHIAAMVGEPHSVRLLLERGAEKDTPTRDGKTACQLARAQGHEEVAAILCAA